jgi:hypothetical protein
MSDDGAVRGSPISGANRPSRAFRKGRVCSDPGCETRLSMYNEGKYCYLHEPMITPRTRGRKIA